LRITERFRRTAFGHIDLQETFDDPSIYGRPWTVGIDVGLVTDTEMLEYVCNENEKDQAHLVGKASDETRNAVKIARQVLSKYVGSYELRSPVDPNVVVMLFNVTLSGEELSMDVAGKDPQPMTPLSETTFSVTGTRFDFAINDQSVVTHLIIHVVEGDLKAVRRADATTEKR
jgi:hypothetical protein